MGGAKTNYGLGTMLILREIELKIFANDLQKDLEMDLTGRSRLCMGRLESDPRFLPLQGLVCLILLARIGLLARLRAAVEKVPLSDLAFSSKF